MRHFQLPIADPLFQEESLQILKDLQAGYEPTLVPELGNYVAAQALFIVKVAGEHRSHMGNWPGLLATGQQAFMEIWQACKAKQEKLPWFVETEVRQAILTKVVEQLAGETTAKNLASWARDAGESEAIATAFANYHRRRSAEYEQDMAKERARFGAKVPANEEEAADLLEELAEVAKNTVEIPATVLSWAWAYIEKYKEALVKGHSPEWADTYADHFHLTDEETDSEREAYDKMRERNPSKERVNEAVYREAYNTRLDRGEDYAAAYAKEVGIWEYETADVYAEAYVEKLRAGKSELHAAYYASEVCDDADPKYAELEAELYEQALAEGMNARWAREYAEWLAAKWIEYAETEEDKELYRQEAVEYIAQKRQKP